MTAAIERNKDTFLYQQVISLIRDMQQQNTLRAGEKLPSLRKLAEQLSVSIPTVKQAYLELERQGIVDVKPKSGYYMKAISIQCQPPKRIKLAQKPVSVKRQSLIEEVYDVIHRPGIVPLGIANPVAAHPSDKLLARTMRRIMSHAGAKVMAYGPMNGYPPLRRQLAIRYLDYGIAVDPEDIVITNGAQEALAIALKCVANAGDVIAVESPCYFGVLELIESLGMMAFEIPLCPDKGLWLEDLQEAIAQQTIRACVFSSSISNPMGSFMPDDRRKSLVQLLEKNNIPLIEDDVYGDLYFTQNRATPAQKYARKGLVITCASFSKTAAPSYRVGWLVAPKYTQKAKGLKRALSCSSSLINQWTLSDFIASGDYDRNMRMLRHTLQNHKNWMIALVRKHFPENTRISNPQGGGVLWIELPKPFDTEKLFYQALKHGISLAPGTIFSATNKFKRCFRISYALPWSADLEHAVETLGQLSSMQIG